MRHPRRIMKSALGMTQGRADVACQMTQLGAQSFPRKRESTSQILGNAVLRIHAFAGMTAHFQSGRSSDQALRTQVLTLATSRGWLAGSIGICRCGFAPCRPRTLCVPQQSCGIWGNRCFRRGGPVGLTPPFPSPDRKRQSVVRNPGWGPRAGSGQCGLDETPRRQTVSGEAQAPRWRVSVQFSRILNT
jgi:hypothetical protein